MNAHDRINLDAIDGLAVLPSSLKRPDGTPRFNLHFPTSLVTDLGAIHLIRSENGEGYEPATRMLLERVLRRGDLFLDVGAHWGFFTLQAATHPAGGIDVVAFEPELVNASILAENITRNKAANVAVICAACGDRFRVASLVTNSTMGHSIRGADLRYDQTAPAKWVPLVPLDDALANLMIAPNRRLILKIDAEGFEAHIVAGAKSLLTSGRIALIVWECGGSYREGRSREMMIKMAAFLNDCGFRHVRPPEGHRDGPLTPFDPVSGHYGNVFSVGPELHREFNL